MTPAVWQHVATKLGERAAEKRKADMEFQAELTKSLAQAVHNGSSAVMHQMGEVVKGINELLKRPVL